MNAVMLRMAAALLLVCSMAAARRQTVDIGPVHQQLSREHRYTLVLNREGLSGHCRGNAGTADMINTKSKRLGTRAACQRECDRVHTCVGYTYSPASEQCSIHGPGMGGKCSLGEWVDGTRGRDSCGLCSVPGKLSRATCGECSVKPSSGWDESENFCFSIEGAVWTPGKWTAAEWTEPTSGWTGDSHRTTHVHTVDGAAGAYCYDKYPYDGVPQCKGVMEIEMDEEEQICQKSFDTKVAERQKEKNMCPLGCDFQNAVGRTQLEPRRPTSCTGRESLHCTDRFNGEQTAADCTGPCAFIPAPANTRDLADTHSPILYLPGWERELRSTGDTVGATFAKGTIGKCVAEGNGIKPINSKRCPGSICRASNGLAVSVQEGCAQACLDDPSGTCVGYSHSERECILYSPYADKHLVHENGDTWVSDAQPTEPCISYDIPRVHNS